ncbi:MAG: phage tail assembly chaperone [Pseudomonadota bacterium]
MAEPYGFAELYALAVQRLGWRPDDFWQATPKELLDALTPAESKAQPCTSEELKVMLDRFPDP